MLGGLERLGFDQNRPFEPDAMLVFDDHGQETTVLIELPAQIRVQQRIVPLAPSPKNVILPAHPVRGLETVADLRSRPCEDFRIGTRGRAGGVAWMTE